MYWNSCSESDCEAEGGAGCGADSDSIEPSGRLDVETYSDGGACGQGSPDGGTPRGDDEVGLPRSAGDAEIGQGLARFVGGADSDWSESVGTGQQDAALQAALEGARESNPAEDENPTAE